MENLAGRDDCDSTIRDELTRCGIHIVSGKRTAGEVPYSLTGALVDTRGRIYFTFERAWRYWMVAGRLPLAIAAALYRDPTGRADVRVAGHCGCPAPKEWAHWYTDDGHRIIPVDQKMQAEDLLTNPSELLRSVARDLLENYVFSDDPESIGTGCVESYHVDSELGLALLTRVASRWIAAGAPVSPTQEQVQSWL